jgi:hypothetical protein
MVSTELIVPLVHRGHTIVELPVPTCRALVARAFRELVHLYPRLTKAGPGQPLD